MLPSLHREAFPSDIKPHASVGELVIQLGQWVVDAGAREGYFARHAFVPGAWVLTVEPVGQLAEAPCRRFGTEIAVRSAQPAYSVGLGGTYT